MSSKRSANILCNDKSPRLILEHTEVAAADIPSWCDKASMHLAMSNV